MVELTQEELDEIKNVTFSPFDAAQYLETEEDFAYFMADAFETNDPAYIAHALGVVARAKGMAQIAKETGLSREQLSLSFNGKTIPTLQDTLIAMKALGISLTAKVAGKQHEAAA